MDAKTDGHVFVRTTVTLREDFLQRLKRGERGLSETLNEILAREFGGARPDMFGVDRDRRVGTRDLRDHDDH